MKTYILLTPEITNMGGAQMYTANKLEFLQSKGWNVQVFFPKMKGEVKIKALEPFVSNWVPDMAYSYFSLSKGRRNRIIQKFKDVAGDAEEIVIESQVMPTIYLAEKIAEKLGGRHIINCLDERIIVSTPKQEDYLEYKLKRWEVMNAGERRLKRYFINNYTDDFLKYVNVVKYDCSNVVADDGKQFAFAPCDYTILSVGRLDKPYIQPMMDEIVEFANVHQDKKINVLFVGGSFDGKAEPILRNKAATAPNLTAYLLGYTFPVSKSILDAADVAIATANSVLVSSDQDIPTIVTDIHDSMGIGVYGYTTENKFARVDEPPVAISELLEDVLANGLYPRKGFVQDSMQEVNDEFEKQLAFVDKSKANIGYYDVDSMVTIYQHLYQMFARIAHDYLVLSVLHKGKRKK